MNRLSHILLLTFIAWFPLSAQKIVPTPEDLYADANEFIFSGDYNEALFVLLMLQDRGFSTPNLNYKIGECYLNIQGQKIKAIPYLKNAVQNISVNYSGSTLQEEYAPEKSLLYLGIAYRLDNDFDNALLNFNNYMQCIDDAEKDNRKLAEYHIERCNYARELIASPAKFLVDTLSGIVNSGVSNFNPLVTFDEKILFYIDQLKFYDAVMHTAKLDNDWMVAENLTPMIKSDGDHYATGISSDGTQLFLTCYDPYHTGELFTTRLENGQWLEMQKLNNLINTRFNETHASLSPDGKILYFTSDRKGGYGGTDIYRSLKIDNGDWDKPVNLGPLINTQFNEESPFVSTDGKKLFFSSQGHYNMGGYDIFFSSLGRDGNWMPPVNIGYPLNTTDDDLFFFPLDTGNIAYQAKFLASTGHMDIVRYTIIEYGRPARFIVNGKIELQADPGFSPANITVAFVDRRANDTVSIKPLNEDGSFRQKLPGGSYKLDFSDKTKSLLSREIEIPDYFPHDNLVFHDKIIVPASIASDTIYIKDIRFDFDASRLSDAYLPDLMELLNILAKYPAARLQVNGYADALGSAKYNLKLSLLRANSVMEYLNSKLDRPDRITVNAFGEKNPVAVNKYPDGNDNAEGRRYNRRVEIIVVDAPDTLVIIKVNDIPESARLK